VSESKKGFVPMKVTVRFVIGMAARGLGKTPDAVELSRWTAENPDLFPEPWDLETAAYALRNPDQVLNEGAGT
jgi:hypothetical protein